MCKLNCLYEINFNTPIFFIFKALIFNSFKIGGNKKKREIEVFLQFLKALTWFKSSAKHSQDK